MISYMFLLFLAVYCMLSLIKQLGKPVAANKLPPGPKGLPLIGNLHQLGDLPHKSLQKLSIQHGPLMFLKLGLIPTLVVSSVDWAREIFKNHDLVFSSRPALYASQRINYNGSAVSFAPYGDYWREFKKILILELLTSRRVKSFEAVRYEEVKVFLDSIALSSSPVNLSEMTTLLTNSIVCRIAFGKRCGGSADASPINLHEMLRETQELLGGFCVADFFPRLRWLNKFNGFDTRLEKSFRGTDNFLDKVIKAHMESERTSTEHEDLVDVLLRLQKDSNQETVITNDQIKGVLMDIFIAGIDTSAATLVWIMAELIKNPSAMTRAKNEAREAVKGKEMVEESDLSRLIYLKSVVKEALRLQPPAPLLVPRETTETCKIKGWEIPAKTRVFFNAKSIGMDPNYWENPEKFEPERFIDGKIDFGGQHIEMLAFGAGRRGCPGINFAMPLIELALANLVRRFEWKLPCGLKREDVGMEEASGITVHKKAPLWLIATPSHAKDGLNYLGRSTSSQSLVPIL